MRKRTFLQRITQLGNIASIECELMLIRNQHGVMPRTKKAKEILKAYEMNAFGRVLDLNFDYDDKAVAKDLALTNDEWRGIKDVKCFPGNFTEYEENEVDFGTHTVEFKVSRDEENGPEFYIWDVRVTLSDGKSMAHCIVQFPDDSAKWTFYEMYGKLCMWLGIEPAYMV